MRRFGANGAVLAAMLLAGLLGRAQTTVNPSGQIVNPSGQKIVVAGQVPLAADAPKLNEKQKALAEETDKLLSMANELKVQVAMTSKNILSMKVVRKAEEIEFYAHRMKGEAKK